MPDMINPEWNNGQLKHIVWNDELCASCLNAGSCPLIQVLYNHVILTHSGVHVAQCKTYSPDKSSRFYHDDNDMEKIKEINTAAMQQQIDLLNELMRKAAEGMADYAKKSHNKPA